MRPTLRVIRGRALRTVHANDFTFYEEVDELVQEEPVEALRDPERAGLLSGDRDRQGTAVCSR